MLGFGVGALVLLLLPFLDRGARRGQPSPFWTWFTYGVMAYIIVVTFVGYRASAREQAEAEGAASAGDTASEVTSWIPTAHPLAARVEIV